MSTIFFDWHNDDGEPGGEAWVFPDNIPVQHDGNVIRLDDEWDGYAGCRLPYAEWLAVLKSHNKLLLQLIVEVYSNPRGKP